MIRLALLFALLASPAAAGPSLCRQAGLAAAARHGVPPALMLAIGEVESGRGGKGAWPWTLNIAGRGAWFDSRGEALRAAERAVAQGISSIDLGCFQVNRRWHGAAFDGLPSMLDPETNADYAARFLAALKAEAGDWQTAAGWYHSRTPVHARRYRALVAKARHRAARDGPRLARLPPERDLDLRRSASAFGTALFSGTAGRGASGLSGGVRLTALAPARPLLRRE